MIQKFTTGPWELRGLEVVEPQYLWGKLTHNRVICTVATPEHASVIVAARELRDALKDAMSAAGGGTKSCGHEYQCVCTWGNAEAALAKASGKNAPRADRSAV